MIAPSQNPNTFTTDQQGVTCMYVTWRPYINYRRSKHLFTFPSCVHTELQLQAMPCQDIFAACFLPCHLLFPRTNDRDPLGPLHILEALLQVLQALLLLPQALPKIRCRPYCRSPRPYVRASSLGCPAACITHARLAIHLSTDACDVTGNNNPSNPMLSSKQAVAQLYKASIVVNHSIS
jgi:hypothetical protein